MPIDLGRRRVEAKAGMALPNGLLQAAAIIPSDDPHDEAGVDWFSMGCGPANLGTWCESEDVPALEELEDPDKLFDDPSHLSAPPVTVYAGIDCGAVGWTYQEGVERARANLAVGEQAALERWTWALLAAQASEATGDGDGTVLGRLGVLEDALAGVYGGVGIVHVPVVLAAYMQGAGLAIKDGAKLRTLAGHQISIGAGYPGTGLDGSAAPDGDVWMMISGPIAIRQGEIFDTPGTDKASVQFRSNNRRVLAERISVVQIECGAFTTLVTKSCCPVLVGS